MVLYRKSVLVAFDQHQTIAGLPLKYARFEYNEQESPRSSNKLMSRQIQLFLEATGDDIEPLHNVLKEKFEIGSDGAYASSGSYRERGLTKVYQWHVSERPGMLIFRNQIQQDKFLSVVLEQKQTIVSVPETKVKVGDL